MASGHLFHFDPRMFQNVQVYARISLKEYVDGVQLQFTKVCLDNLVSPRVNCPLDIKSFLLTIYLNRGLWTVVK